TPRWSPPPPRLAGEGGPFAPPFPLLPNGDVFVLPDLLAYGVRNLPGVRRCGAASGCWSPRPSPAT
ncbi:hypothetical protein, partial [Nonomuraea mesophila]|uniref:hypothetical protein n=1 Tax=Nonomuraea mesophila TaxID=2530382 RepID=UPI001C70A7D5